MKRGSAARKSLLSNVVVASIFPVRNPLPERAERDEADPELLERRQHLRLGVSRPQRVLALQRGDGLDRVRAADRLRRRFGQAEVPDLALPDQLADGARDVLDRDVRVYAVLIEEIDRLDAQPSQRGLRDLLDVLRPAVHADLFAFAGRVEREPELRGDHHPVAERRERLAHELFVHERAVRLRGIEERDAALDRRPQERGHLPPVRGRAVGGGHAHAAEPDRRDLRAAGSEPARAHGSSIPSSTPTGGVAYLLFRRRNGSMTSAERQAGEGV